MNYDGPIIIVEDDQDEQMFYKTAFENLPYINQLLFFENGDTALHHLKTTEQLPFLIISEIRLPKMDGFELKKKLLDDQSLNSTSIPFVFFTLAANKQKVKDAFNLSAQGFFIKENTSKEFEDTLRKIMEYWRTSFTPSSS